MGSSYLGEPNMRNNERVSGSSSSRKGKKNNSDKPKQPQRGLGVAMLEKIRLNGQMGYGYPPPPPPLQSPYPSSTFNHEDPRVQTGYSSVPSSSLSYSSPSPSYAASYSFQPNDVVGVSEYERTDIRYGDSQPRWDHSSAIPETQPLAQSSITRPFLNLYDSHYRSGSMGVSSQNYESSDNQELDLELRLSL